MIYLWLIKYPTVLSMEFCKHHLHQAIPDSKVHGANMGPIWGRQDPGGPHIGPMNFAIWDIGRLTYKSWSREIGRYNECIALHFDRRLGSAAAEVLATLLSERLKKSKPKSRSFKPSFLEMHWPYEIQINCPIPHYFHLHHMVIPTQGILKRSLFFMLMVVSFVTVGLL